MKMVFILTLAIFTSSFIASPSNSMSDASKALTIQSFKNRYEVAKKAEIQRREKTQAQGVAQFKTVEIMKSIRKSIAADIKESGVHFAKGIPEWEVQEKLDKLVKENHYVVNIGYENDKPFPNLYLESPEIGYSEEFSPEFFDKTKAAIFGHYLGQNYNQYSVTLLSANRRWIGLQFFLTKISELESLIQHSMIRGVEHMGNFHSDLMQID